MKLSILYQRIESPFIFLGSLYFYNQTNQSWILFVLLLLVPDIFMLGYLANNKLGANLYNIGHSYIIPALITAIGFGTESVLMMAIGLIWTAHISMDRSFGYGLKDRSSFKDTHLGKIGKH